MVFGAASAPDYVVGKYKSLRKWVRTRLGSDEPVPDQEMMCSISLSRNRLQITQSLTTQRVEPVQMPVGQMNNVQSSTHKDWLSKVQRAESAVMCEANEAALATQEVDIAVIYAEAEAVIAEKGREKEATIAAVVAEEEAAIAAIRIKTKVVVAAL